MLYLHKLLPIFVSPIFVIIIMLCVAWWRGWTRVGAIIAMFVWFTSMPVVSQALTRQIEQGQTVKDISTVNRADAVVVLSGMLTTVKGANGPVTEWGDPDRFFGGIALIKATKADQLIFTQGKFPWDKVSRPEGEVLREKAIEMGVDANIIRLTEEVGNTAEEALAVQKMFSGHPNPKVILVTSAFHMPRASKLFVNAGLEVDPFPVDFKAKHSGSTIIDYLPSAHALSRTSFVLREYLGRLYYWLRQT